MQMYTKHKKPRFVSETAESLTGQLYAIFDDSNLDESEKMREANNLRAAVINRHGYYSPLRKTIDTFITKRTRATRSA